MQSISKASEDNDYQLKSIYPIKVVQDIKKLVIEPMKKYKTLQDQHTNQEVSNFFLSQSQTNESMIN